MKKLMSRSSAFAVLLAILIQLTLGSKPTQALVGMGPDAKKDIQDVKLSELVKIDESTPSLPRLTQGLRSKKVVFAWFSVYVAQVFSSNAKPDFSSIVKLKESLTKGLPVVVSMTFVRSVDIGKIVDGFEEGFKENAMDAIKPPYSDFLAAIKKSGDVKDRQKFFFTFLSSGPTTGEKRSLSVETNGKEIFSLKDQTPESVNSFFNIWLGKPSDSGLEKLQEAFLKPEL